MPLKGKRSQEDVFDEMKMPYTYDMNLGAVVGACKVGVGDGEWYWEQHGSTGRLMISRRDKPYPSDLLKKQKHETITEKMQIIATSFKESEASSSDQRDSPPVRDAEKPQVRARTTVTDQDRLIQQCTVVCTIRPCDGKNQYKIITPDNKTFRSKRSAAQYMSTQCAVSR